MGVAHRDASSALARVRGDKLHKLNLWNSADSDSYRLHRVQPTFPRPRPIEEPTLFGTAPDTPTEPVHSPITVPDNHAELVKPALPATWKITLFNHVKDNQPKSMTCSLDSLIMLLTAHDVRAERDGKLFSALFNGTRGNDAFISTTFICLDFDHGQPRIEDVLQQFPDTLAIYYTTHSHCWKSKSSKKQGTVEDRTYTPEHPRFRVVLPLSRSVDAEDHAHLVAGVKSVIPPGLYACLDKSCFERVRIHYLPSCIPEHKQYAVSGHQIGDPLDADHFIFIGREAVLVPEKQSKPQVKAALPDTAEAIPYKKVQKIPSFENWHTPVYPHECISPAWKALSANSISILIICRAKAGNNAKKGVKDNSGRPIFEFTKAEALDMFGINGVTRQNSLEQLIRIGWIDKHRQGGGKNGINVSDQFRLSERWKDYQPPPKSAEKKYNNFGRLPLKRSLPD